MYTGKNGGMDIIMKRKHPADREPAKNIFKASYRQLFLHLTECFCCTMVLTIIVPALWLFAADRNDRMLLSFYAMSFLIFPFILVVRSFLWKAKFFHQYCLLCAACLAVQSGIVYLAGGFIFGPVIRLFCTAVCAALTLIACMDAGKIRTNELQRQKAMRENDFTWTSSESVLEHPRPVIVFLFIAVYGISLLTDCPAMCDTAFLCTALWIILTLIYRHLTRTDRSLKDLRHLRNVPVRRIRFMGAAAAAALLLILAVIMVPSIFTRGLRPYRDVRSMKVNLHLDPEELRFFQEPAPFEDINLVYDKSIQKMEPGEPSILLEIILYIAGAAALLLVLWGLLKALLEYFSEFKGMRENDDIITPLPEDTDTILRIRPAVRSFEKDTGRARIRRKYRKEIRRRLSEPPKPYEMPFDLETRAGIADTSEGRELHRIYEEARYSG